MTTPTVPSWVFVQGRLAELKAMTAFKDLQIREASLSRADFGLIATHGDLKLLEKLGVFNVTSDIGKTAATIVTETETLAETDRAAPSMDDGAIAAEASDISGYAIHALKLEQLKAVEAFQGSCQKLIEGGIKLAASVNRKGKHFPEESIYGLVFVFDRDPEDIL